MAKKFIKSLLSFFLKIPINSKLIYYLEKFLFYYQGKAWGASTIDTEVNSCLSLLKQDPNIFIDIGANKGLYTEYMLKKVKNLECHIFEPQKFNYEILKKKFKENNIFINNFGLSDFKDKKKLFSDFLGSGSASLTKRRLDHFNIGMNLEEIVDLNRFDDYWGEKVLKIDYVKIDVEGHELNVLKGFGELINNTKLIQFEFGGCNIDTRTYFQDFWYFFKEKNFLIFRITPRGPKLIKEYSENAECFITTNYVALNKKYY